MIRTIFAAALLCAFFIAPAEARQRHRPAPQFAPECFTIMPCEGAVRPGNNFLSGVKSIRVTMKWERRAAETASLLDMMATVPIASHDRLAISQAG